MLQAIEDASPKKSNGLHYAFIICLGGFLTQAIVLSCQRLPSVALESIRQTLNCSYADVGLITSVFMVFYAGLSIVWGMLGDKIGTRWAITLSCGLSSVGAILFGLFAQTGLAVAIATWAIAGVGTAGLLMAILPKIVSNWFAPHKRGFGMSLITPGANFSAIILGIVAPIIISNFGWQMGYVIFGIVFALITVFVAAFFREKPADKGLAPFGAPAGTQAAPAPTIAKEETEGSSTALERLKRVLKMPISWHFGIFYVVYQIGYMAATQYYVSSIQSVGFGLAEASLAITIGGVLTIIVELILGSLSDHVERKNIIGVVVAISGILGLGYFLYLANTPTPSLFACYAFVAGISATTGVITVIMTAAGEYYDDDVRATGTGFIGTVNLVGRYLGPWIAGMLIDATGVVGNSFAIVGITMVVAAVIAFTFPRKRAKKAMQA